MGTQRGQVIWAMHICLESQIPDNPGLSRQDRNVPVQWLKNIKYDIQIYPNRKHNTHKKKRFTRMILKYLECVWHFVEPYGAAWTASCSCWNNPSCGLSIKWGPGRNRVPKKEPKIPSIKWRPLLTLEHAQNTKEVLCKSQENKKNIL